MGQDASSRPYLDAAVDALATLRDRVASIDAIATRLEATLTAGRKIMTCGNGGSAAEAMHLAEELVGRYRRDRRPLAAICLNADSAALTCIANDWEYAEVFARQVEGLGKPGDALVVLSTSGRSQSIVRALERARARQVTTIGLLGPPGSPAETLCDLALTLDAGIPSSHAQENHIVVIHAVLQHLDSVFAKDD